MRSRRRIDRPKWRWLAGAVAIAAIAWFIGFLGFVADIPRATPAAPSGSSPERHDAIVVLTGGSGRLEAGLALLEAGRAGKMFVSGVYHGVDVATLLALSQSAPRNLDCCIILGYSAGDTAGNAEETAAWMAGEHFATMLLVTANYHLPRSLLEFRSAMPGIDITPWTVHPARVEIDAWWRWPGTAKLLIGEYSKFLAAGLRAWLRNLHKGGAVS